MPELRQKLSLMSPLAVILPIELRLTQQAVTELAVTELAVTEQYAATPLSGYLQQAAPAHYLGC